MEKKVKEKIPINYQLSMKKSQIITPNNELKIETRCLTVDYYKTDYYSPYSFYKPISKIFKFNQDEIL
jgi:hypothetical protein